MNYKTPLSFRNSAAQSQNWLCFYCGLPMGGKESPYAKAVPLQKKRLLVTAEHLHARQDGGKDSKNNIVAAHAVCNRWRHRAKRPKPPTEHANRVKSRVAKSRWFNGSELKLLINARNCIGQKE